MGGLMALDTDLFRFINHTLANPLFDWLMPELGGNVLFGPAIAVAAVIVLGWGGRRGRICVLFLVATVLLADGVLCNNLKSLVGRIRPCNAVAGARVLIGCGSTGSMPSAHAVNWFAAVGVLWCFYRRSLWFVFPLALGVSFSRIYNGVHYPGDILVGAAIGAVSAAAMLRGGQAVWHCVGRRWFPMWYSRLPNLLDPDTRDESGAGGASDPAVTAGHWIRLGYLLIVLLLLARLVYIASGHLELSEDEAYQWLWSKHLALSYYSKPPMIAYVQFVGTHLWGDNELGVRFFSPVIAGLIGLLLLRFFAREVDARTGFWLIVMAAATPLLAVGATVMTVDSLSVLFWTTAMLSGWRAVQDDSLRHWLWTGLWMGLGFLSKYTSPLQWACWITFFALWPPARFRLRRPGPYLALLVNLLCALPVLVWNAQHHWITLTHLKERGGLDRPFHLSLGHLGSFLGSETALLNPIFFGAMIWASLAFWKRERRTPLMVFLFSMGAPVFLFYLFLSFRSQVHPNWIAPGVIPLLCLAAMYWSRRLADGASAPRRWLKVGVVIGLAGVMLLHDTDLLKIIAGRYLPPRIDPKRRVCSWQRTARVVEEARDRLLAEGKPVFLIGDHYGLTSLMAFYSPWAKAAVRQEPVVYCLVSDKPKNQFYFWQSYTRRRGQNALFVRKAERSTPAPPDLTGQFASVTDTGVYEIRHRDRIFHRIQIFECRDLR